MKNILILGAGLSTPYMIHFLLTEAEKYDWFITVGDKDLSQAQKSVQHHPRGTGIGFDINDAQ
jgi:hypothetical protein